MAHPKVDPWEAIPAQWGHSNTVIEVYSIVTQPEGLTLPMKGPTAFKAQLKQGLYITYKKHPGSTKLR